MKVSDRIFEISMKSIMGSRNAASSDRKKRRNSYFFSIFLTEAKTRGRE